jgi:uncharacterized protein (TIGR00730 family)
MSLKEKLPHPLTPELAEKTWSARESWRVFGIMAEFVEATEKLNAIRPAVSIFGSARVASDHPYYILTEQIARRLSDAGFSVISGGGPGIMEAANRGAFESGAQTAGLNIVLPHEQAPNPYLTPELSFQFYYFALRKMHFLMRARALVAFPGGFGTLDELFETLCLIQTGKSRRMPVLLYDSAFWTRLINFEMLVEEGMISPADLDLFQFVDDADEAFRIVADYHLNNPMKRVGRGKV